MSTLKVSSLAGRVSGDAPTLTDGAVLPVGVALTGGGNINVTGVITATSFSGSGENLTGIDATALKDGSGNVKVQANSTGAVVTGNINVSGIATVGTALSLADNVRAKFGNSGDLEIYHDSNNSFIRDSGSGRISIVTSQIQITNSADSQVMIRATELEAAELYYAGGKKFETTSTGTITTGILTATSMVVGGLTYPTANGTDSQVLTSNGSGAVQWEDAGGGAFSDFDVWNLGGGVWDYVPQAFRWTDDIIGQTTTDRESPWYRLNSLTPVGNGMSQTGGIWTFPTTGMWKIDLYFVAKWTTSGGGETQFDFHRSTDSGSSYSTIGKFYQYPQETNYPIPMPMLIYLNCTNASTTRFKVTAENQNPYQMQLSDQTSIAFSKIA